MTEQGDRGIESLLIWKRAIDYVVLINQKVLPRLPSSEKFSLSSQLRRSAQSVPANIAEGFGRFYYQEGIRFCYIARGSLEETYSHLVLANKLGYLSEELFGECVDKTQEIRKLINGYIRYLKRSKRGSNEPGNNLIHENLSAYLLDDWPFIENEEKDRDDNPIA